MCLYIHFKQPCNEKNNLNIAVFQHVDIDMVCVCVCVFASACVLCKAHIVNTPLTPF